MRTKGCARNRKPRANTLALSRLRRLAKGFHAKSYETRQLIVVALWPIIYDSSACFFATIDNYCQGGRAVE